MSPFYIWRFDVFRGYCFVNWLVMSWYNFNCFSTLSSVPVIETKCSRMDQVEFMEDSL